MFKEKVWLGEKKWEAEGKEGSLKGGEVLLSFL